MKRRAAVLRIIAFRRVSNPHIAVPLSAPRPMLALQACCARLARTFRVALMSAPRSSNSCATLKAPLKPSAALCSGVSPSCAPKNKVQCHVVSCLAAPRRKESCCRAMIAWRPKIHTPVLTFKSAPRSINNSATALLPYRAALCSAMSPKIWARCTRTQERYLSVA